MGWEGLAWIDLSQDVNRCRAVVLSVMSFRCHEMWEISWLL